MNASRRDTGLTSIWGTAYTLMNQPACETPDWQFIAGSGIKPKLDDLEVSLRTSRPSNQPQWKKIELHFWNCSYLSYPSSSDLPSRLAMNAAEGAHNDKIMKIMFFYSKGENKKRKWYCIWQNISKEDKVFMWKEWNLNGSPWRLMHLFWAKKFILSTKSLYLIYQNICSEKSMVTEDKKARYEQWSNESTGGPDKQEN